MCASTFIKCKLPNDCSKHRHKLLNDCSMTAQNTGSHRPTSHVSSTMEAVLPHTSMGLFATNLGKQRRTNVSKRQTGELTHHYEKSVLYAWLATSRTRLSSVHAHS